jgi:hypothetical protein
MSDAEVWDAIGAFISAWNEDSDFEAEAVPGPLADKTEPQLEGLVVETIAWFLARKERGLDGELPDGVWAFVDGAPRLVGFDEEPRLVAAFATMLPIIQKVFQALKRNGVHLRGARCSAYSRATGLKSIDLRVRIFGHGLRGHRAIVEVKWTRKTVRKAKNDCLAHFVTLRQLAQGGQWRGPHPRSGKGVKVRYVGGLAVSKSAWHFRLFKVPKLPRTALAKVNYGGYSGRNGRILSAPNARRAHEGVDGSDDADSGDDGRPAKRRALAKRRQPVRDDAVVAKPCPACQFGIRGGRFKHTEIPLCRHAPGAPREADLGSSDGETDRSGMGFSASDSDSDSC